jgi:hypothetical protein
VWYHWVFVKKKKKTGHSHRALTQGTYTGHLHRALPQGTYTRHLHRALTEGTYTGHLHRALTRSTCTGHLHRVLTQGTYTGHLHRALTQSIYTGHLHRALTQSTYTRHLHSALAQGTNTGHSHRALTQGTYTGHLQRALAQGTCTGHLLRALAQGTYTGHLHRALTLGTYTGNVQRAPTQHSHCSMQSVCTDQGFCLHSAHRASSGLSYHQCPLQSVPLLPRIAVVTAHVGPDTWHVAGRHMWLTVAQRPARGTGCAINATSMVAPQWPRGTFDVTPLPRRNVCEKRRATKTNTTARTSWSSQSAQERLRCRKPARENRLSSCRSRRRSS